MTNQRDLGYTLLLAAGVTLIPAATWTLLNIVEILQITTVPRPLSPLTVMAEIGWLSLPTAFVVTLALATARVHVLPTIVAALLASLGGLATGAFIVSWPTFQHCVTMRHGAVGVTPGPRGLVTLCTPDTGTYVTAIAAALVVAVLVVAFVVGLRAFLRETDTTGS